MSAKTSAELRCQSLPLDVVECMVLRPLLDKRVTILSSVLCLDRVLDDVLVLSHKDFALPECEGGECEQDHPHRAHYDRHEQMPNKETPQIKYVTEKTDGRNPSHCASASASRSRVNMQMDSPLGNVNAQPARERNE